MRMRLRRAERCLLRAEVALEAGYEEDARAALDEARRLNSHSPDIDTLRAAIEQRAASRAAEQRAVRRVRASRLAATAALLILSVGLGAFWLVRQTPAAQGPPVSASAVPAQAPATQPSDEPAPPVAPPPAPGGEIAVATTAPAVAAVAPAMAAVEPRVEPRKEPEPERRADLLPPEAKPVVMATDRSAGGPPPAPAAVESADLRPAPAPALPDGRVLATAIAPQPEPEPIERVVANLPSSDVPRPAEGRISETPAAIAPPAEEPRVRAVLSRYESAYSGLNAAAAQAVWPGVDRRSLARAFNGLESQRVSLGRCAVAVDGTTARADCRGSVTWTPKVGGGPQTTPRQWNFMLANANGAWQITRAEIK